MTVINRSDLRDRLKETKDWVMTLIESEHNSNAKKRNVYIEVQSVNGRVSEIYL